MRHGPSKKTLRWLIVGVFAMLGMLAALSISYAQLGKSPFSGGGGTTLPSPVGQDGKVLGSDNSTYQWVAGSGVESDPVYLAGKDDNGTWTSAGSATKWPTVRAMILWTKSNLLEVANDLSDLGNATAGRRNLGLGTVATYNLDGNSTHAFRGDGSWGAVSSTESDPIVKAINGIVKSNGSTIAAAVAGTDYSGGTAALATGILKSTTTTGTLSIASAGTDYQAPLTYPVTGVAAPTAGKLTKWDSSGNAIVDGLAMGTMTDTKYCIYTAANGLVCNSEGGGSSTMTEVDGHADGNLTAAQVSNTIIYNTGQADANATIVMPTAAAGYSFIATVGTTRAGKAWCLQSKATDLIYLDGTATADHGKACMTPAVGSYLTCFTFKTDAYDWICRTGIGTWWRE